MRALDSDLLRTFLAVADAGSVTGGAARIGRSQSATSIQIGQLEDVLGTAVFTRHGRGVALAPAGERLIPVAREVVRALDGAMADIAGHRLEGALRVGIPDDHGKDALSEIIARFTRDHPKVDLTVHCALSTGYPKALAAGELDLAVHEVASVRSGMELLRETAMCWVASKALDVVDRDPLPVALFDRACWWRDAALDSLASSGKAYRVIYTSESVTGISAAVEAGMAVAVLDRSALTSRMAAVPDGKGFGVLPTTKLVLQYAPGDDRPVRTAMAEAIKREFAGAGG